MEYSALLRDPSDGALPCRTNTLDTHKVQENYFHFLDEWPKSTPAPTLTQVLRVDERGPPLQKGTSTPDRSPATLPVVKLATGNVHLV